jgi:uncharacterized protein (TIGR02231 family)
MNKLQSLFFILFACSFMAQAQKPVSSKITETQVYFSGAQITREATITLQSGTNILLFDDLPHDLNPRTLLVESTSDMTLLSVKHNLNYLKNQSKPPEVVKMEDSLKILQQNLQLKNAILQVYREEESMLLANKSIGGESGVQAENLKNTSEFFRTRLMDVKTKQHQLSIEIVSMNEHIQRLNNQISQQMSNRGGAVSQVYVSVSSKASKQAKIQISYFVPNASWTPTYDIRATQIGKPIQLSLKANVVNNTGEAWDNVKLSLSTANPLQSGVKPNLSAWYLSPYISSVNDRRSRTAGQTATLEQAKSESLDYVTAYETAATYTTVEQSLTTIEYTIHLPYNVPADGREYSVDIQEFSLPAVYEYQSVPKIDKDAFLIARITGWEEYNLLPGSSNLFAEGKYIGTSYIDPASVLDTLNISLGRDKGITVQRELKKDFSSERLIGSNKSITRTYEIQIRNRKNNTISMVIEDHIPLSRQKEIQVEFDPKKSEGAIFNEQTGMLRWQLSIKPGETKTITYSFTVKHPKEMSLQVW